MMDRKPIDQLAPAEKQALIALSKTKQSLAITPDNYSIYRRLCQLGLVKLSIANGQLQLTQPAIEMLTFRDSQDIA